MIKTNKIGTVAGTFEINTEDIAHVQSTGMKNLLINGGFDIWQRGETFTGGSGYKSDRWETSPALDVLKNTRGLPNGEIANSCKCVFASSGYAYIGQIIENGSNIMKNKVYTVSFKATGDTSNTIELSSAEDGDANVVSIGSFNVNAGIDDYSFTFTVPNVALTSPHRYLRFAVPSPTVDGSNFEIMQIQLEEGSVATPFEQRPIGYELSLCQRYYQVFKNTGSICSGALYFSSIAYGVVSFSEMRSVPYAVGTFNILESGSVRTGTSVIDEKTIKSIRLKLENITGATSGNGCLFNLKSPLTLDAEL